MSAGVEFYRVLPAIAAVACLTGGCAPPPLAPISDPVPTHAPPATAKDSSPASVASPEPCPHAEGEDAQRFEYDAFGPAAMSFDLLGQAWWQWDSEGHAFEEDGGTIWVVVHDGLTGDALATRFPVREDQRCDHRYVALPDARAYLRAHIDELADADVPELALTRSGLQQTLTAVDTHFN